MHLSNSKVDSRLNVLSIIGPASVILPVLLLIIKESPFYIDVAVTSFVCLLICSKYRIKGLCFASGLFFLVMAYDFIVDGTRITPWDMGLSISLQLSFVITALASQELKESFQAACKEVSSAALFEIEEWKNKIKEVLLGKEALSQEIEGLKAKLLPLQDGIKDKTEQAEMFKRLLSMARNELVEQTTKRHHFEELYLSLKNSLSRREADAKEEQEILKSKSLRLENELHEKDRLYQQQSTYLMEAKEEQEILKSKSLRLESEMQSAQDSLHEKDKLYHQQTIHLMDAGLKIERLQEESNEKLELFEEQLENLIDRLKNLQSEKEELEKALVAALSEEAPLKESRELKRVFGLHDQLRLQFNEKCQILDQTRRELFQVQEELHTYQKSVAFEEEEIHQAYEAYIIKLSETITQLEDEISVLI